MRAPVSGCVCVCTVLTEVTQREHGEHFDECHEKYIPFHHSNSSTSTGGYIAYIEYCARL